jgi:hypothetical protein
MMEDENSLMNMTQDCVVWNENDEEETDLRKMLLENTSAVAATGGATAKAKEYSPNQDVEDLLQLIDSSSSSASQQRRLSLERSHSVPMTCLGRRQSKKQASVSRTSAESHLAGKRKRPSSATGENVSKQKQQELTRESSAALEELLKELETPVKSLSRSPIAAIPNRYALPVNKRHGLAKKPLSQYQQPHQKSVAPSSHPPSQQQIAKPLPKKQVSIQVSAPSRTLVIPNKVTPTYSDLVQQMQTTRFQQQQQPGQRVSVPYVTPGGPTAAAFVAKATNNNAKPSPTSEFANDDFVLSEADMAKLDAVETLTESDSAVPSATANITRDEQDDDEFGHLDLDFSGLDEIIHKKLNINNATKPLRESFGGNPFDDDFDFAQLDQMIEQRQKLPQQRASSRVFRVDLLSLQFPPVDAKVFNPQVSCARPTFISFSRYQVIAVREEHLIYTKAVMVKSWTDEMADEDDRAVLHRAARTTRRETSHLKTGVGEGWIFLRGEWYHTPIEPGDAIHLCSLSGRYETNLEALPIILDTQPPHGSDSQDDLTLVLHPDTLVPPTIVSETVGCSRRAVLRSRLGSTGISSKAALYGTMRHLLFEKCMSKQDFSVEFARESILSIVRETAENLVALGIREEEAQKEILRVLPRLQQFHSNFIAFSGDGGNIEGSGPNPDVNFSLRSVESTEESLVSPELGLKGNIDVTVKAMTQELGSNPRTGLVGIELKTGHNQTTQNAHMAQLALYTLMLTVRYGHSSPADDHASGTGMLLYMNPEGMRAVHISPVVGELKSLIAQRNVVAADLKRASVPRGVSITYQDDGDPEGLTPKVVVHASPPVLLPEVLSGSQPCTRCYANRECMLYAAANMASTCDSDHPIKTSHSKLLDHFCGRLDKQDFRYFLDWDRLIDLEAHANAKLVSLSWLKPSKDQELNTGRTISSLVVDERLVAVQRKKGGSESVSVVFKRSPGSESKTEFSRLQFEAGCHVVVSADASFFVASSEEQRNRKSRLNRRPVMHLARGLIQALNDDEITVKITQQDYRQILAENEFTKTQRRTMHYRLDRDDIQTGLGTTRQNLINLLTGDVKPFENSQSDPKLTQNQLVKRNRHEWLREAIIKLRAPEYDQRNLLNIFERSDSVEIPGCNVHELKQEFHCLNTDQQEAVKKVIMANDYALIQGLPGTGKSSTIAFVARLLAAHNKRVLITSYTHAAVDNLMMKLLEKGVKCSGLKPNIVRIGYKGSTHPAMDPILLTEVASDLQRSSINTEGENNSLPSPDAIDYVISNARIVGVTALSIPRSSVLVRQDFDVVIIDEAGQISQPAILGALLAADKFVLVGDHHQLPPLVTSEAAEKAGFGVSMLSRLAERHPNCVAQLTLQYRMHEAICQICNDIVYAGKLKCANDDVRNQTLALLQVAKLDKWLSRIVNPERHVVFANTDHFQQSIGDGAPKELVGLERRAERTGHGNMVNDREIHIVRRIVQGLLESGLPASAIGIISPFRAQIRKLNESTAVELWKTQGLEISTIDRYQGRDKQVIIISFVRSNSRGYSGRLLNDFRRLNVAVSRAMKKLIMIGSLETLQKGSEVLRPVLQGLKARKQVENIPEHVMRSQF